MLIVFCAQTVGLHVDFWCCLRSDHQCRVRLPPTTHKGRKKSSLQTGTHKYVQLPLSMSSHSYQSMKLGQVLAMWLGETTDAARNRRRASMASVSRSGHSSQIDILRDWLEIGLSREFRETCNFEIQSSSGPLRAATSATTAAVSDSLGEIWHSSLHISLIGHFFLTVYEF